VGLVYDAGDVEPGASVRWSVLERVDERIAGGSTFIVRGAGSQGVRQDR